MKRRRVLFLTAAVLLATGTVCVWPSGPKEPVHQGKALTQWINEAVDVDIFEQTDETKAAMTAFGTNSVPFLLYEFTRPVSRRQRGVAGWINRVSPFNIHIRTGEERVRVAGLGFMLLETNAAPTLPVLMRYLDDPERVWFVKSICYDIGDASVPYLTAALDSTSIVTITNALDALHRIAYRSDVARDAFIAAMSHRSSIVRTAAVNATTAVWTQVGRRTRDGEFALRLEGAARNHNLMGQAAAEARKPQTNAPPRTPP